MRLYHSFPGFLGQSRKAPDSVSRDKYARLGLLILRSILTHGLLLVPEKFPVRASPNSPRLDKIALMRRKEPMFKLRQTRACFTLTTAEGLFVADPTSPQNNSHACLFGRFAIGVETEFAPDLGILPVIHYYDYEMDNTKKGNSLSPYIVDRLFEIRNILAVLSHLKAIAHPELSYAFDRKTLGDMGVNIHYEKTIEKLLEKVSREEARLIFRYFSTDRVPMWNLVESIDILLSLFQSVHSRSRNRPLAYYEQREWRLIHHNSKSNTAYSLGDSSWVDRPDDFEIRKKKKVVHELIRPMIDCSPHLKLNISRSWVLESVNNRHFRDYISQVVVPKSCEEEARSMIREFWPEDGSRQWKRSVIESSGAEAVCWTKYERISRVK